MMVCLALADPFKDLLPCGSESTVSFHNFKSQNFKLSVSNPKSKYVAYLSVPSRISNCQGLGHKNKHDILKTDRISIASIIAIITVIVISSEVLS